MMEDDATLSLILWNDHPYHLIFSIVLSPFYPLLPFTLFNFKRSLKFIEELSINPCLQIAHDGRQCNVQSKFVLVI